MLQIVTGIYRAFEEGMAYWRIAGQHAENPSEMAKRINAVMSALHEAPAPVTPIEASAEERAEVMGKAA